MTIEISESLTTAAMTELAEVFRALSDPTRLAIYERVRTVGRDRGHTPGEIRNTVSEIAREFDLSLSTVSHHLKELRRAGLIRCERRGQFVYCATESRALTDIDAFIKR